jgi:CAP12/Pycsar effector protein, TIR domain
MSEQVKMFLGSSGEGSDLARRLQEQLQSELGQATRVVHWKEAFAFPLGATTIESLEGILDEYEFAVLLFTPDDALRNPAKGDWVVRDNVLLETGLFMGRLGRERTFVVLGLAQDVNVPSDLQGVTHAVYTPPDPSVATGQADFSDACSKILEAVRRVPARQSREREAAVLYRLLNACTYPAYEDLHPDIFDLVGIKTRPREEFRHVEHVLVFMRELFYDYVLPTLRPQDVGGVRIYFAYYLGDGLAGERGDQLTRYVVDAEADGRPSRMPFVIGMSNTRDSSDHNWRTGRGIPGRGKSNCAEVFFTLAERGAQRDDPYGPNYQTPGEQAIHAFPVEWRLPEPGPRASLGVLSISSERPRIDESLKHRCRLLAMVIGFVFSLYANEHLKEPGRADTAPTEFAGFSQGAERALRYARRVVSLRRRIASHFEETFLTQGLHRWHDSGELRARAPAD